MNNEQFLLHLFRRKKCLTPTWKNRLQGLLVGLLVAAIATGITVAVFLTSKLLK